MRGAATEGRAVTREPDDSQAPRRGPEAAPAARPRAWRAIPRGIWALGLVSLFMDSSSELIHALLPVFMVSVLGASGLAVGLVEGAAEATAAVTKVFSGALSDFLGRRKPLVVLGYGLAAATKPIFPLAGSVAWVFAARFLDRIGKGIRGAPRDALIADIAPPQLRGASYGLRQSLDTVGAFLGPLAAVGLMAALADDIRAVFWVAVLPALAAVAVLVFVVHEPEATRPEPRRGPPIRWAELPRIGPGYWSLMAVAAAINLARFSEAFLVLRAARAGLPLALVPLVLVLMSLVYAVSAYPAGLLSDRFGRRAVVGLGLAALIAADAALALAQGLPVVLLGVALWGLHMGLSQALLSAMVADSARAALRGTAFGLFNLLTGAALFAASLAAGWLWDAYGPAAPFYAGLAVAVAALAGLFVAARRGPAAG